ncbi:hypothetical protein L209DRAFT_23876 [Thermothelomyces heterothallicus CBS 203.75]
MFYVYGWNTLHKLLMLGMVITFMIQNAPLECHALFQNITFRKSREKGEVGGRMGKEEMESFCETVAQVSRRPPHLKLVFLKTLMVHAISLFLNG